MNEDEIDMVVVRPDRFILEDVQGVMMPDKRDDGSSGRDVYLSWRNGKKEVVKVEDGFSLPNGTRVVFDPIPKKLPTDEEVGGGQ